MAHTHDIASECQAPLMWCCLVVLQIQGLPTMVFVGLDKSKPALRTEGLLPANTIMDIIKTQLMDEQPIDVGAGSTVE